jgi:hypothetical protein
VHGRTCIWARPRMTAHRIVGDLVRAAGEDTSIVKIVEQFPLSCVPRHQAPSEMFHLEA